jgi:MFS family permease
MPTAPARSAGRSGTRRLILLLALAIFIQALDRGNFSTAAPLIKDEFGFTNTQVGILTSAFFFTYVPGHAFSGWLVEKFNAYRTLTWGLAAWSLATFLTGWTGGFASLLVMRLLLGLGESTAFPASSKLIAQHAVPGRLASANAWTGVGLSAGNGMGIFAGGLIIAQYGWHLLFFVFGALSLLWLVPWLLAERPAPAISAAAEVPDLAPDFAEMFSKREMWGAMCGHFCNNYSYFLVLSWLPLYLVKQQGFSLTTMAWLGGAVYLISSIAGLTGARIVDGWIGRGANVNRVRKSAAIASLLIALVCMLACASGNTTLAVAGLLGYGVANGLGFFSIFSIAQTLAGPSAAGKWMGLQNGFGGLAGILCPIITGASIDATGDYRVAFLIAAASSVLGMLCWGVVIRKIEPVWWSGSLVLTSD